MGKIKKFWLNVFDILDDVLAYFLTIVGILSSTYIPMLQEEGDINIQINYGRIIVSAVVALLIISKQEKLDEDEDGSKDKSKAGRKKRFLIRMANALGQGVLWATFMKLTNV
jgi:hypothetical protein